MIQLKDRVIRPFFNSTRYWQRRYKSGRSSGAGSRGANAAYKARFINDFIRSHNIETAIEFGFGDGVQLDLCEYPDYLGFEVSRTAIQQRREQFRGNATRRFKHLDAYAGEKADLTVSLDVLYHLVESPVYDAHLTHLFDSSDRYVLLFSTCFDGNPSSVNHVRHRNTREWIDEYRPDWQPIRLTTPTIERPDAAADFFAYEKPGRTSDATSDDDTQSPALRVLIADDDVSVRSSLRELLIIHGCEVTSVASCPEAIESLASESFDLFVCDYNFGSHTAETLADHPRFTTVPTRILHSASDDISESVENKFTVRIQKAAGSHELLQMVCQLNSV
jgi:CheY-like chemotaxis protein